jgi:hypothetical protein
MRIPTAIVATAALLIACGTTDPDTAIAPTALTAAIVSDPAPIGSGGSTLVYVSVHPGSLEGASAKLINARTRDSTSAVIARGGFDPVALPAIAGDTIEILIAAGAVPVAQHHFATVPASLAPRVVRTEPTDGVGDVSRSAPMLVVFSEPIDVASPANGGVSLSDADVPIPGTFTSVDGSFTQFRFLPGEALRPGAMHVFGVGAPIRDLDGDAVEQASVSFTTAPISATPLPGRIAFVSTRTGEPHIYVINANGSGLRRLTPASADYHSPTWTPDGTRIAYVVGLFNPRIHVMNADGTGSVGVARGADPGWSPNGQRLVFSRDFRLYSVDADGSNEMLFPTADEVWYHSPAMSPDGTRIAFVHSPDPDWTPWQVHVRYAAGAASTPLLLRIHSGAAESKASWSPDGTRIALWNYALGITVANAEGEPAPFTVFRGGTPYTGGMPTSDSPLGADAKPVWSPDGMYLAFVARSAGRPARIFLANAVAAATPWLLVPNAIGADYDPAWSR